MSVTRYAVYFTPAQDHPLTRDAETWLGRSAWRNEDVKRVTLDGTTDNLQERFTRSARKYGFHATMKAPFRLTESQYEEDLRDACAAFALDHAPTDIADLIAKPIGSFSALVPAQQSDGLRDLAAAAVEHFEPFRAPLTDAERERRLSSPLTDRQKDLLTRWGYPYVFDEFRFHLTLGGGVSADEHAKLGGVIDTHFGAHIGRPLDVDRIALFRQDHADVPFYVLADYPLSASVAAPSLPRTFTMTA
ncbi:MAG: DUF1045 domain-containing protein [Pseudomonadota bacterium]